MRHKQSDGAYFKVQIAKKAKLISFNESETHNLISFNDTLSYANMEVFYYNKDIREYAQESAAARLIQNRFKFLNKKY